jgi:hypothetical protein
MPSVMGLLEEREAAARVRAEELRADMERITAELADAEAVLERRVIAWTEPPRPWLLGANRRRCLLPVCGRRLRTSMLVMRVSGSMRPV